MVEVERKETQTVRLLWKCETEVDLPKLPFQGSWVRTWASNAVASWIYAAPAHPQGRYPYKRDRWDGKNLCHTVMPTMFIHLGRKKTRELPISGHHRPFPGFLFELLRTETPAKRSGLRSRALWFVRGLSWVDHRSMAGCLHWQKLQGTICFFEYRHVMACSNMFFSGKNMFQLFYGKKESSISISIFLPFTK